MPSPITDQDVFSDPSLMSTSMAVVSNLDNDMVYVNGETGETGE